MIYFLTLHKMATEWLRLFLRRIYQGERYKRKSDAVDPSLFVKVVLASLRYNYDDETDFVPRNICVVAQSGPYNSVGCLNVTFVGENDNPPKLSYTPAGKIISMMIPLYLFYYVMVWSLWVIYLYGSRWPLQFAWLRISFD